LGTDQRGADGGGRVSRPALKQLKCLGMPWLLILLVLLGSLGVQADDKRPSLMSVPDPEELKAYTVSLTDEGQSLAAFNFAQDRLFRPHLSAVTFDPTSDRFYWKEPMTGKLMSIDREQFFKEIWGPYSLWQDRDYLLSQAQHADPVQLAKTGDATEAFNYVQENREDGAKHLPVDQVWYDEAKQLFHWKGPKIGKEMSMSRDQFMTEIYYPYFKWIWLHNSH
jgi:hypothetical protein